MLVEITETTRPGDADLWRSFKGGNKEALAVIYRTYIRTLYNYGTRLTHDDGLVEDCIQDLFIEIWRNRAHLADTDSIKYYLFRALRRKIARRCNQLNKHVQHGELPGEYEGETVAPYESEWVLEEAASARKEHLQKAITHLTKRQKEILFLRYYENLSHQEIASIMVLTPQAVYNLIHKTLAALKQHLAYLISLLIGIGLHAGLLG